jgi:hypothetical protein
MANYIERDEDRHGMSTGTALLLGLGIGIIGTVVVIAANEERFGSAVRNAKKRTREISDNVHERYEEVRNNTRHKGAEAAYAVEHGAKKIGDKLSE